MTSQSDAWSKIALRRQSTHGPASLGIYSNAVQHLSLKPGSKVLDAGCGSGEGAEFLASTGCAVAGNDLSPKMIELARERLPTGDFRVASTEQLPFADACFHGAVAINSLHFCERPLLALRELRRVVRVGGAVVINSVGPRENWDLLAVFAALLRLVPRARKREVVFFDPARLASVGVVDFLAREAGFTTTEERYVDGTQIFDSPDAVVDTISNTALYQGVAEVAGETSAAQAVAAEVTRFIAEDGKVHFNAQSRLVVAS